MYYIMLLIGGNNDPTKAGTDKSDVSLFSKDLVPEDHILRQIDEAVDFSFVRDVVSDCYCPDNGRPGIDPELVVRMILVGYLYNLSENSLCQEVKMHAAYRLIRHLRMRFRIGARSTSFAIQVGIQWVV